MSIGAEQEGALGSERRQDGGSIFLRPLVALPEDCFAAGSVLPGSRLALAVLLGAQLGRVDRDLVALVVEVDVLVLVAASLLVTAFLLLGRHAA